MHCVPISRQPLNRSLPNLQELLLMENKCKFVNFSSFHVGHYSNQGHITNFMHIEEGLNLRVYLASSW